MLSLTVQTLFTFFNVPGYRAQDTFLIHHPHNALLQNCHTFVATPSNLSVKLEVIEKWPIKLKTKQIALAAAITKGDDTMFMVFGLILTIFLVVGFVYLLNGRGVNVNDLISPAGRKRRSPLDIAQVRYARGEIDKETYEQLCHDLTS